LEILSTVGAIFAYYDRDGVDGLNWDLSSSNDVFTCSGNGTYDCVDFLSLIKVGADLTFGALVKTDVDCNSLPGCSGYGPNCRVVTLTSSATLTADGSPVLTVKARASTQPITINGVLHSPHKLKWDLIITPPWSSTSWLGVQASARIGVLFFHAGKAGLGAATYQQTGQKALTFNAAAGRASYFGYVETATTDNITGTVVITQTVTAGQITAFAGVGLAAVVTAGFKAQVTAFALIGWVAQITLHSFVATKPNTIYWDPEVGMNYTAPTSAPASGGSAVVAPCACGGALLALFL